MTARPTTWKDPTVMAADPAFFEPRNPQPPEPGLTAADVVARAQAIAPTLVARQAETERRTYYGDDTHALFEQSGFYRILVPRRYGGYEFGLGTFVRVVMELARGCPSTGWMFCLGAAHSLAVGSLFDERAQAELFGTGEFRCPAVVAPSGSARRGLDGQWILDGTWKYCSGSPYATHFLGHALVAGEAGAAPELLLFVAPRSQWEREEDWGRQLGLKGSGSHSITMRDGRVPEHLTLLGTHLSNTGGTEEPPGVALHGNPEYGGGPLGVMFLEFSALAVGMARGALEAYEELMRSRVTLFPPVVGWAENPDYQMWYGEAAGLIATAEAATLHAAQQWSELCREGPGAFDRENDLRIATICREVIRLCWRSVERFLFPTAGSSATQPGQRLERVWRDLSMLHSHAGAAVFLPTSLTRAFTQARFQGDFAGFDTQ
jgi:3-hydroxy-9,10-secoandrosta-1,3,5(10)-triene-9,17-dione monooxygenase